MPVPTYFSTAEVARRERHTRLRQLFEGEHEKAFFSNRKARYEYITINWLELLSNTWSRLQFANFPEISAPAGPKADQMAVEGDAEGIVEAGDTVGEAISDIVESLALSSLCRTGSLQASWSGAAILKLSYADDQRRVIGTLVEDAQVTWVFDDDDPATPTGASYWYSKQAKPHGGKEETVWIEERQRLRAKELPTITLTPALPRQPVRHRAPVMELDFTYHAFTAKGDEVELAQVFENPDDIPEPFTLPLDVLTLIYIPNKQTNGNWRGETDYSLSLQSIQAAINNRYSLNQHILDAHSKPTLLIPESLIVEGMVPVTQLEWIADSGQAGGAKVGYVEWSGELGASFQQCDKLWEQFNACAGLTTAISQPSQAETGRAKELEMVGPVAEVRARRPFWEDALQRVIYVAMVLEQRFELSTLPPVRYARVVWPVVLPDSRTETASVTQQLRAAKALSIETAVRLNFPTWTDAEVAAEVTRIKEEQQQEAALQQAAKAPPATPAPAPVPAT